MAKIGFVTDSTCYLPQKYVDKYNVKIVPLQVIFADRTYKEGVDITPEEFYAKLAEVKATGGAMPTTSQPTPADFVAAYEELIAEGFDQIITITVTAKSSGTFASAQLAKDMVKGADIKVVDSTTANMQTGYMLLEAARTIEAGGGVKEALAAIEEVKAKSCLLFTVTELEHLERSGRTVGAKEVIEAEVKVKPVVSLEGGVPHVVDKVRTDKAGIDRVIELAKERLAGSKVKGITIVQTNIPERAQRLEERLRQEFDYQGEVFINELGSAVAVHFGPGCLGMAAYGE